MNDEAPLTRLRETPDTASSLVEALEVARRDLPTAEEMDWLASALGPLLSEATRRRPKRRLLPYAAGVAASLLAAAVAAMGIGATFRYLGDAKRERNTVVAPPSVASTRLLVAPKGAETPVPPEGTPAASAAARAEVAEKLAAGRMRDRMAPAASASTSATIVGAEATGAASFPDTAPPTEIALLGRAQRALSSDPPTALALTAEHAAQFPNGALNQERELIAIQALLALGRRQDAVARGARFRANFPGSAHLRRLDLLLGN